MSPVPQPQLSSTLTTILPQTPSHSEAFCTVVFHIFMPFLKMIIYHNIFFARFGFICFTTLKKVPWVKVNTWRQKLCMSLTSMQFMGIYRYDIDSICTGHHVKGPDNPSNFKIRQKNYQFTSVFQH